MAGQQQHHLLGRGLRGHGPGGRGGRGAGLDDDDSDRDSAGSSDSLVCSSGPGAVVAPSSPASVSVTVSVTTAASDHASTKQARPDSFRPASMTVNSTKPSNVSIITTPMEAASASSWQRNEDAIVAVDEDVRDEGRRMGVGVTSTCSSVDAASPGASELSPPPSYHDIPGTVPVHQGVSRGPPPSYDDAVNPNADPPSYDSLFGRIRDTHKASRNLVDFLVKLLILLLGTIGCTIACSITVVIPICMIVVGSIYFNDCPAEPYIPVFLIVGGAFSVFKYLIGVTIRVRRRDRDVNDEDRRSTPLQSLISCFLCGWFITGCVWVYRIYRPVMDESKHDDANYCNRTVYIFAFWLITTAYIFLGLFTSCICCFSIVSVVINRSF